MNPSNQNDVTDVREYVRPVLKRIWLIVAIVTVAAAITYAYYDRQPSRYRTQTQLYVQPPDLDNTLLGAAATPQSATGDQAVLLRTQSVAQEVAKDIGYAGAPSDLLAAISATAEKE